jgi:sigma-B regulation protein RsbU (phosphoserine phosphatase)
MTIGAKKSAVSSSIRSVPAIPATLVADDELEARVPASALGGRAEHSAELAALNEELTALRREQALLHQAIFEAAQIQRRLCAPRHFQSAEIEVAGEIFPVRHLSGDFVKVMELGPALGVVVGDIAGKGLSAGIWQTHVMGLIHRCALAYSNPAEALAEINRDLCAGCGAPPLTAMFFARVDPIRGEINYCNAGLPSPLILRRNRGVARLEQGGPMLGAFSGAVFASGAATLDPGDTLLAYSDGVTECRNSRDEEFDVRRLSAAAAAAASTGATAGSMLFSTLGAVLDFAAGNAPEDDLTLLVLRRREALHATREHSRPVDAVAFRKGQAAPMQDGGSGGKSSVS